MDDLDATLIDLFAAEPRIGVLEASRRLGVARGTVQARLDKLAASGVITGWGPDLDPEALGYPVTAFLTLEIRQGAGHDTVAGHLAEIPEVLEACTITGAGDMWARVVARSNADLQRVIDRCSPTPASSGPRPSSRSPPRSPTGSCRLLGSRRPVTAAVAAAQLADRSIRACSWAAVATAAAGPPHSLRSAAWVTPCGWPVRWCQAATSPLSSRRSIAQPLVGGDVARDARRSASARRSGSRALALPVLQQAAHLVGLEQAGDAEEVHLLLRPDVHLAGVAELGAVVEHVRERRLRAERLERSRSPRRDAASPACARASSASSAAKMSPSSLIRAAQHVVALELQLGGEAEQRRARRQEDRRRLAALAGPHEPADGLGEEQRRGGRRGVDTDREPRARRRPRRPSGRRPSSGRRPRRTSRSSSRRPSRPRARRSASRRRSGASTAAYARAESWSRGDHQPAGVRHVLAHLGEPPVRRRQHRGDPGAARVERGPQRLRGHVLGQRLAEPGRRPRRRRGCATAGRRRTPRTAPAARRGRAARAP